MWNIVSWKYSILKLFVSAMMASGHAKTGSVSVALKVYLLTLFVGLYHFESNKTRQKPSYLFVRDKLPMINNSTPGKSTSIG